MGAIKDLLDGGSEVSLLEDLSSTLADREPPVRERLALEEQLLGSPARIGSFDELIAPGSGNPVAGDTPFDVATVIAADSITANEIAAGTITADLLTVGGIGAGRNFLFDSSFESGFGVWGVGGAGPAVIDGPGSPIDYLDGVQCIRWTGSIGYGFVVGGGGTAGLEFKAGHWYCASVWTKGLAATSSAGSGLVMETTDAVSGSIKTSYDNGATWAPKVGTTPHTLQTGAVPTAWTRYITVWQQNTTQTARYVVLSNSYGGTSTGTIYMDAVQVEEGSIPTAWGPGGGDVRNVTGHTVIDSTGIHVIDGEISIEDQSGTEVMNAAGFSGPWDDFMHSGGIYNNTFAAGTVGTVVNSPPSVPYWAFTRAGNAASSSVDLQVAGEAASNHRIRFQLINSNKAIDDRIRVRQLVPIVNQTPGIQRPPFTATCWGDLTADSGSTIGAVEIALTAIGLDGSTPTGATALGRSWPGGAGSTGPLVTVASLVPDALTAFILIEIGLWRPATTLNSCTFLLYSVQATYGPLTKTGVVNVDMGGAATGNSGTIGYDAAGNAFANIPVVVASRASGSGTAPKVHCWAGSIGIDDFIAYCATGDGTTSSATIAVEWIATDVG
jgi:hypothetical protein